MVKAARVSHSFLRSPILHFLVITLLVFLGVAGLREKGYLEGIELDAYDWSLRLRPSRPRAAQPIPEVPITDQDIHELGHWPITDGTLTRTLGIIMRHHPRTVGVEIY